MKKFIAKILVLLISVLSILYLANKIYLKIGVYENDVNFSINKFDNVPDQIDICDFGNSLAVNAFEDYRGIDGVCFNFALSAQSLSYDYRIMQQYENCLTEDTIVFITLYYFCFQTYEDKEDGFQSKNERYYYFLEPQYIKEYNPIEYAYINTLPILWQSPVTIMQKVDRYVKENNDLEQSGETIDYENSALNVYRAKKVLDENNQLVINQEELNSLYGMLDICNNIGAKPILIITPYRKEYTELFSSSFYEQYYSVIEEVCTQYRCELYDYSKDDRFNSRDAYFADAYHLSSEGSDAFLNIINQEIIHR